MRTEQETRDARIAVCDALMTKGLNEYQRATLAGMLTAIAWMLERDSGTNALAKLIAGQPVNAGVDPTRGREILNSIPQIKEASRGSDNSDSVG